MKEFGSSCNTHGAGAALMMLYVFSIIMLKERPHSQVLHGMILAFVGVSVIFIAPLVRVDMQSGQPITTIILGNSLFVIAMIATVFHTILNKKVAKQANPSVVVCIQFFFGSLMFVPLMFGELQTWSFTMLDSRGIVGILFGTLCASAGAYYFLAYALRTVTAQTVGIYSYIKPVVAVLVAIPLLGEIPDTAFIIGAILIFIGVYIAERHPHYYKVHKKMHGR